MGTTRKKFGEILIESRSISSEMLDTALKAHLRDKSSKRLGAVMVEMGLITSQQVTEVLGLQFMLPVIDIKD